MLLLFILSNSTSTSAMMESLAIELCRKVLGKTTQQALPPTKQNDIFLIALSISGAEKPLELELGNDGRETIILSPETEMPPKPHPHNDG